MSIQMKVDIDQQVKGGSVKSLTIPNNLTYFQFVKEVIKQTGTKKPYLDIIKSENMKQLYKTYKRLQKKGTPTPTSKPAVTQPVSTTPSTSKPPAPTPATSSAPAVFSDGSDALGLYYRTYLDTVNSIQVDKLSTQSFFDFISYDYSNARSLSKFDLYKIESVLPFFRAGTSGILEDSPLLRELFVLWNDTQLTFPGKRQIAHKYSKSRHSQLTRIPTRFFRSETFDQAYIDWRDDLSFRDNVTAFTHPGHFARVNPNVSYIHLNDLTYSKDQLTKLILLYGGVLTSKGDNPGIVKRLVIFTRHNLGESVEDFYTKFMDTQFFTSFDIGIQDVEPRRLLSTLRGRPQVVVNQTINPAAQPGGQPDIDPADLIEIGREEGEAQRLADEQRVLAENSERMRSVYEYKLVGPLQDTTGLSKGDFVYDTKDLSSYLYQIVHVPENPEAKTFKLARIDARTRKVTQSSNIQIKKSGRPGQFYKVEFVGIGEGTNREALRRLIIDPVTTYQVVYEKHLKDLASVDTIANEEMGPSGES